MIEEEWLATRPVATYCLVPAEGPVFTALEHWGDTAEGLSPAKVTVTQGLPSVARSSRCRLITRSLKSARRLCAGVGGVGQGRGQKNAKIVQDIEKTGLKDSKITVGQKFIPLISFSHTCLAAQTGPCPVGQGASDMVWG
jgi:hypothetical protein